MRRNAWLAMLPICAMTVALANPVFAASGEVADMANRILGDLGGAGGNFITFFRVFCALMGVTLVATGIYGLTQKKKNAVIVIVIGAIIVSIPNFINIVTSSVFEQQAANSIISEYGGGGSDKLGTAAKIFINLSVFMIQVVGFCAVYRGLKTIADVAGSGQFQPTQQRTAIIFIVAGVICINIVMTLELVANTMGSEGEKYYNMVFGHINQTSLANQNASTIKRYILNRN